MTDNVWRCLTSLPTVLPNPAMRESGPRPTLGELQLSTPWVWLWCERGQHHAPLACAVAVIRWGPNVSSDKLRAAARCTSCGSKGATLQHPGWAGNHVGFSPFPTNVDDEVGRPTPPHPPRRQGSQRQRIRRHLGGVILFCHRRLAFISVREFHLSLSVSLAFGRQT
jgi:hypothetical protein